VTSALKARPDIGLLLNFVKNISTNILSRYLAFHEPAWQASCGRPGFVCMPPLSNDLIWGTAALQHAVSWTHIDDEGFATVTSTQVGSKYWVLGCQRRRAVPPGSIEEALGDIDSLNAFKLNTLSLSSQKDVSLGWEPGTSNSSLFNYEGILLTPGSVL
jgi:hypothetical protein